MTVNKSGDEPSNVIVDAAQDNIVGTGAREEESDQENGDEETMIQTDGNMTLTEIVEDEEKPEQPKPRTMSLWMNTKDIENEEFIEHLKNNDILENDYYFSTRQGYFLGWNGHIEKHVRVYGIEVMNFKKTWPKLER